MSAQQLADWQTKVRLRPINRKHKPMSTGPFIALVIIILGVGMVGVLVLATSLQSASAQLNELHSQRDSLSYRQAALASQVEELSSAQNLGAEAWELGMRPNPYAVFLKLADGNVIGNAQVVNGDEMDGFEPQSSSLDVLPSIEGIEPSIVDQTEPEATQSAQAQTFASPSAQESSAENENAASQSESGAPSADESSASTGEPVDTTQVNAEQP